MTYEMSVAVARLAGVDFLPGFSAAAFIRGCCLAWAVVAYGFWWAGWDSNPRLPD